MSGPTPALTPDAVAEATRGIIAEVLFVPLDEVQAEKSLIGDLGAESIDFLDLVFRFEDLLGRKITIAQFDSWLRARLKGKKNVDVTVAVVTEFALQEAGLSAP